MADAAREHADAIAERALTAVVSVERPSVQQALAKVMAELPAIGKDSQAPAAMGGFQFRGIEAIAGAVRPLLAKHGVVIAPRASVTKVVPAPGQKEMWQDVYLEVEWLITGPDGSSITAQTVGIGRDHTDKGANKAQSQAYKYLLLHLFCIADAKDDSDGADYSHAAAPEPVLPEGWRTAAEQREAWDELRAATKALPDDEAEEVKAWVKAHVPNLGAFSKALADEWRLALPAAQEPT